VDRIELVGVVGDDMPLDRLLEPRPLKHRRLEDRSRRIGVVFQKFRGPLAVKTEVEPAVKAGFVAVPTFRDQRPECLRYLQAAQIVFVVDRAANQLEAHRVDLAGRFFDLAFDLVKREGVIGAFVPIAFAVDGVEVKSGAFGGGAPIAAFGAGNTLHEAMSAHGRRQRVSRHDRGHAHALDAAHPRNRHRSRCNFLRDGCLGRAAKEVAGRNRFAAQTPSIRHRRPPSPSWSKRLGASASWCASCGLSMDDR